MGNRASILEKHGYYEAKEIGQGASGTVFRVKKKADEKEYVVKAVQKSESVIKEVAVLKALKHPFIVEYSGSFEDMVNLYIVMEYCEGGDLSQEIQKHKDTGGYFTEDQILNWFAEISSAVQHVHENNILHRDIRPQNIFLDKYGKIRLGDFGTAKTLERSSSYARTKVGTFHYQSPERVEGMPYNSKSDVWALGCVLYELCELQRAFPHESMRDLFNVIVDGPNPTISGPFSTDLRDLVRDLLQKNPGDRPSASDIMARPCILRILCQKSMGIPEELKLKLEELNEVANGFERVLMGTTVGSLTGAVVGAAGGITTIVGLCLSPVTLGASLIVSGVGIGISAAGGATGAASNITNMVNERMDRRTIENIIRELEMKILILVTCFQHIDSGFQSHSRSSNVSPATRTRVVLGGSRILRGLNVLISPPVEILRGAAQAAKLVKIGRAAEVTSGLLAGLFLAFDIFFIVDDSMEIHAMRQGGSTTSGEYAPLVEEHSEEASTDQASGAGETQEASPDGASTGQTSGAGETQEASPDGASSGPQTSGAGETQEASRTAKKENKKALKTREFINEIRKESAKIQKWLDKLEPLYPAIAEFEEACMSV